VTTGIEHAIVAAGVAGRLVADTARMLLTILIVVAAGYAVSFRFSNGFVPAVALIVLATVFGLAICCIAAFTGLAIGDEESVQAFGLIWLFPITFLSSAFVPIPTMPGWLQAFANNQPVTYVINTMRALALGGRGRPALASHREMSVVCGTSRLARTRQVGRGRMMADNIPEAVETELARLAERLTEPGERECLRCFLMRMITEFGCDGTYRWTIRWRDVRATRPGGLLRWLEQRGGCCDCEVLINVFPDYPPTDQPLPCAGVLRPGSAQPCQLRSLPKSA